jgi:hypothetical protein
VKELVIDRATWLRGNIDGEWPRYQKREHQIKGEQV